GVAVDAPRSDDGLESPSARIARALLLPDGRYTHSRRLFLRALGLVYLVAFLSLYAQLDGLIGSHGILPAAEYLARATEAIGDEAKTQLITVAWISASD